jgi:hypothetical protein
MFTKHTTTESYDVVSADEQDAIETNLRRVGKVRFMDLTPSERLETLKQLEARDAE